MKLLKQVSQKEIQLSLRQKMKQLGMKQHQMNLQLMNLTALQLKSPLLRHLSHLHGHVSKKIVVSNEI